MEDEYYLGLGREELEGEIVGIFGQSSNLMGDLLHKRYEGEKDQGLSLMQRVEDKTMLELMIMRLARLEGGYE